MILDDIVAYKRIQLQSEKEANSDYLFKGNIGCTVVRDFKNALNKENISIIAEIKGASPSAGKIKEDFDPERIAKTYDGIDIDAVSVLTEAKFFNGKDEYIERVKKLTSKPILRKDFIIDEYQIYQSKALRADAILLITAILGSNIKRFYEEARNIGLYCIAEVHNTEELYTTLNAGCDIIGINNRNLKTFEVDLKTTEKLIRDIPKNITIVSESGIKVPEDIKYLKSLGVNGVLIGETLMRKVDKPGELREFIESSRSGD